MDIDINKTIDDVLQSRGLVTMTNVDKQSGMTRITRSGTTLGE